MPLVAAGMEAFAIQVLVQTEKHVVRHTALTSRPTRTIAVIAEKNALMTRLAKMEFAQDALLHVLMTKHAAKPERHAARFAVMMVVVRIPIIAEKVMCVSNANVRFRERLAAVVIVVLSERFAVVLELTRHVAPQINIVMEMDIVRHVKLQYAPQNRNAAMEHALTIHAVIVQMHAPRDKNVAKTNAPMSARTPIVLVAATLVQKEQNVAVAHA